MRRATVISVLVVLSCGVGKADWRQLDYPGARKTYVLGVDGASIVGYFTDEQGRDRGFLFDGSTWTLLHYPGAELTRVWDVDGTNMVGMYRRTGKAGLLYDGADWRVVSVGNRADTSCHGIDGARIVGAFLDRTGYRGYLYDGVTYRFLDYPGAEETWPGGIDGSNIIGWAGRFSPALPRYGFLYDGTTWTRLEYPGAARTWARDIDGGNIVGNFEEAFRGTMHGFLYDGTTWTQLDYPGAIATQALGIDGNRIVGEFRDADGVDHGFVYRIDLLPLELKSAAIDMLEGLLSEDWGDDDLVQAIGYLHMSLGNDDPRAGMSGSEVVWGDPAHVDEHFGGYKGADVFQYEQAACDKLDAYVENDENSDFFFEGRIEEIRQMLAEADQMLAGTAIEDAYANGGNLDEIAVAEQLKAEGDTAKAKGGTEIADVALDKYEEAWEKATNSW